MIVHDTPNDYHIIWLHARIFATVITFKIAGPLNTATELSPRRTDMTASFCDAVSFMTPVSAAHLLPEDSDPKKETVDLEPGIQVTTTISNPFPDR